MKSQPIFSLCHPTRRPDAWRPAAQQWFHSCHNPDAVEYILCLDRADWDKRPTWWSYNETFEMFHTVENTGKRTAVAAWNTASKASHGKFLITVSDDYIAPSGWDEQILQTLPDLDGEYVLDVDNQDGCSLDGRWPMLPFSFLTRGYYDRLRRDHGYDGLFHPDYDGAHADSDMAHCALMDGVVVDARRIKFKHLNPERGDIPWDEVYHIKRNPEANRFGELVLERRKSEGFNTCLQIR